MEIAIIFVLILINGVFSMSEIALISARKNRLENAAKKGNVKAQAALDLSNSPTKFLSTVQIGITVTAILTGIISGDRITADVKIFYESYSAIKPYADSAAVVTVVFLLTYITLVVAELLPKRIGLNYPESIAKAVALPMKFVSTATAPFIWLLTVSTDFLLKVLRIKPSADGKVTEEEIKAIIKEGTEGGEVQEIEQDIVERVFHIGDRKVNSLMTHRKSVVFLPLNADKNHVKDHMLKELHSVYPVYGENHDDIVGVVNLKAIFSHFENDNFNLAEIMTEAPYLMEQTTAYKALEHFKTSGIHYAFVSDEYGDFEGIITLNDILEALVGDASDFYKEDFKLVAREDGTWLVDGHYSLHDFLTFFELDELINDYEVNTVSGLIMTELSFIPKEGQKLLWNNFELEVLDMDGVKIDKVLVKSLEKKTENDKE
jgi:putative hemolysin